MHISSLTPISHSSTVDFSSNGENFLTANILSITEAEELVVSLRTFRIEEIGSSPFMQMYCYHLERLSIQAHISAKRQDGNEFVIESIMTYKKLSTLISTLLSLEAWRNLVLKAKHNDNENLGDLLVKNKNSLRCAFILHVETTIVGLLNLICFRREHCEEFTADAGIALADYCARQMSLLVGPLDQNEMVRLQKDPGTAEEVAKHIQTRSVCHEFIENIMGTEYRTSVLTTSLARYLCEHMEVFPLSVRSRILDTHDYLTIFVPLIDEPPWTRRRKRCSDGPFVWEKLYDNKEWKEVAPSELLLVTQCEAQCWLAVFFLTCNNYCRQNYALNAFRKETLLRLRKFLNGVLLDQLPVLNDVMRYMDELSLLNVPHTSNVANGLLLMQEIDSLRNSLVKGKNFSSLSKQIYENNFSKVTDISDDDLRLIATIYDEDVIGEATTSPSNEHQQFSSSVIDIHLKLFGKEVCLLKPTKENAVVTGANGSLMRSKLDINSLCDDGKLFPADENLRIEAWISFATFACSKLLSASTNITRGADGKIHWIQLGKSSQMLVIQLGFKPSEANSDIFELCHAYLSQPVKS